MNFNLNEEIIAGHLVTAKTKRIWNVEMKMLQLVDDICKRHNIKYYVCYGTLLGTIRHQGFIPWDDDMDVCMMRDDYARFIKIAPQEIKAPYFFQNVYTDSMVWGFSKIRADHTCAIEFPQMDPSFHQGIFIDIFPLDTTDDGTPGMKMVTRIKHDIWDCIYNREAILKNIDNPDLWKMFALDKNMILELIQMDYRDVMRNFEEFCESHFNDTNMLRSWSSEVMGRLYKHYEKEWYKDTVYMPFFDMEVPVPGGYEHILEQDYGQDWRTPRKGGSLHDGFIVDPDVSYQEMLTRI